MTSGTAPDAPGGLPVPPPEGDQTLPALSQAARHPAIRRLLHTVNTMTLATADAGRPHAAPVYFAASPQLELFFFSAGDSLHSRHLAQDPRVAAAIYPLCQGWQDIRGLQLHGTVALVESSPAWEAAWRFYQEKFPFVRALKAVVARNRLYVLTPTWVRLVDNTQGFGHKQEYGTPQPR